uniref:Uncharacterized protein n=1 Tax=Nelumbo nucifera TaxID=4432 RepID=A0A822XYW7_NELNU|nr:TPA_asm: hypothetical protein HUJ06_025865 [Nelumbo nucifera]
MFRSSFIEGVMGLLSWWKGKEAPEIKQIQNLKSRLRSQETLGMNKATEVPQPCEVIVFEFVTAAASANKVMLAGYCPVSNELRPCHLEILLATGSDALHF